MANVIVIGGGASGMMAAISAASNGHKVSLYEKNEKLGKKIYITGRGRCNVTNACDTEDLFANMVRNPKFLYSSFYSFTNFAMMDLLETLGCPVKVERGNRVFPVSDKSSDVIFALSRYLRDLGVKIHLMDGIKDLIIKDGICKGIVRKEGNTQVMADAVVVATGGLSYPTTGSTGDGYEFAKRAGHKIMDLSPSLVPFCVKEPFVKDLQGLALKNIEVSIKREKKVYYRNFGEMLFTHFGVSGPLMLSASSHVIDAIKRGALTLEIDLKPALSEEQLDARLLREFEGAQNKILKNVLSSLYPAKLLPVMLERFGVSSEKKVHEITKQERQTIISNTKAFTLTLTQLRSYNEAVITKGGVCVKEVDPSTMESKVVSGLYFAGEVLDLDAVTGGFNLQIAWSSGWLAGASIQENEDSMRKGE